MKELIKNFFDSVGVEHYAVLSYADCKEINPSIMEREDLAPKSVIIFLMPYYTGETVNISRYAASLDYHLALREVIRPYVKEKLPEIPPNREKRAETDPHSLLARERPHGRRRRRLPDRAGRLVRGTGRFRAHGTGIRSPQDSLSEHP